MTIHPICLSSRKLFALNIMAGLLTPL